MLLKDVLTTYEKFAVRFAIRGVEIRRTRIYEVLEKVEMKRTDSKIKMSIIVPIFNSEHSLKRCINSIIEQTYQNIEIILVDDGSTDRSFGICCEFAQKDKRIIVIHKENGGPTQARKVGIGRATGDYIINIDSDDWIEKEWVLEWVRTIEVSDWCDAIYRDGIYIEYSYGNTYISADLTPRKYLDCEFEEELVPLIFDQNSVTGKKIKLNAVLWSYKSKILKSLIHNVNEKYFDSEDLVLNTYCIFNSKSLYITKGGGYHYVQHEGSLSTRQQSVQMMCDLEKDITTFLTEKGMSLNTITTFKKRLQVNAICHNYKSLISNLNDPLPFLLKIQKYSNIILYGAGRVGHSVYNALRGNIYYKIVAVIDKNPKTDGNIPIVSVSEVNRIQFDYIVICSIVKQNIEEMTQTLLEEYKIPQEKIAYFEI